MPNTTVDARPQLAAALDQVQRQVQVLTPEDLALAYAQEFTVHAWDLVQATGRDADLDPTLAEAALAWFTEHVGADGRGDGGPFGAPVPVAEDSDAYTRLAGYVGRDVQHSAHPR